MKKSSIYNRKGFTLVELILYAALVGILLTAGAIFASDIVYGSVKAQVKSKVESEARFAIEKMRQEIVKANSINIESNNSLHLVIPGTLTEYYIAINGSNSKAGVLQIGATNSYDCGMPGTNCLPSKTCVVGVCLPTLPNFSSLSWQDITSPDVEVVNLVFTNISSGTSLGEEVVKIDLTLRNKNPGGKKEFDAEAAISTSISLRL